MKFDADFSKMKYKDIQAYISSIENIENVFKGGKNESILIMLSKDNRKTVQKIGTKISKMLELKEKEIKRVRKMYDFDQSFGKFRYVAGVDEVGRVILLFNWLS